MGVECVQDVEGGIGEDFDLAFAGCGKEVLLGPFGGRHAPGEGCGICLDGLRVWSEGCVGCCAWLGGGEV